MRRNRKGRVLGPYKNRDGYRVIVVDRDGARDSSVHASEETARAVAAELRRQLTLEEVTVKEAIEQYASHLRADKGRGEKATTRAVYHLHAMMPDDEMLLADIGPAKAAELYEAMRNRVSDRTGRVPAVDSQRNCLNECGTFARWAARRKYIPADPFEEVDAKGKRRRGKPQLRVDEARVLLSVTLAGAEAGDRGALLVALVLLTGFRAEEAATLTARDVDDEGRLLWTTGKTGERRMETPDELVDILREVAKEGGSIWPKQDRFWVYRQVRKWCKRAGVAVIPPHGLRGTHSTIAQEHGATSRVVAAALGHGVDINRRAYTVDGTAEQATARRAQKLLRPAPTDGTK